MIDLFAETQYRYNDAETAQRYIQARGIGALAGAAVVSTWYLSVLAQCYASEATVVAVDLLAGESLGGASLASVPILGLAQITRNRMAGNAFRDELASLLRQAGLGVETEVYKRTPIGKRYIDIQVSRGETVLGGIETKVGASRYTPTQKFKDAWLLNIEGYIVNIARDK